MKHLSLFSGIGGFDLAAEWMGWENVAQVEIDPFCLKVLLKNFPNAKQHTDIRTFPASDYTGRIDIITGGFPCQPFSQAGKRRGTADNRFLWPEMLRVISIIKPTWVVAENVPGIINIQDGVVFEQVCADLEVEGYEVQAFVIPALAVNAPHRRDRLWIVANSKHSGRDQAEATREDSNLQPKGTARQELPINELTGIDSLWPSQAGRNRWDRDWSDVAAEFCRVDDVLPDRVDRIKALGNAIVPQIAYEIFKSLPPNL